MENVFNRTKDFRSKRQLDFDYNAYSKEGFSSVNEEIDQTLFEFFVSDYEQQELVENAKLIPLNLLVQYVRFLVEKSNARVWRFIVWVANERAPKK